MRIGWIVRRFNAELLLSLGPTFWFAIGAARSPALNGLCSLLDADKQRKR